jgi:hypothetical protein
MPHLPQTQIVAAVVIGTIAITLLLATTLSYFRQQKQQRAIARRNQLPFTSAQDVRTRKLTYSLGYEHANARQVTIPYLVY